MCVGERQVLRILLRRGAMQSRFRESAGIQIELAGLQESIDFFVRISRIGENRSRSVSLSAQHGPGGFPAGGAALLRIVDAVGPCEGRSSVCRCQMPRVSGGHSVVGGVVAVALEPCARRRGVCFGPRFDHIRESPGGFCGRLAFTGPESFEPAQRLRR